MFRFASPAFFLLLIPVAAAAWFAYRRRIRQGLLFSALQRLPPATRTWRTRAALLFPALYALGLAGAVLALARPQTVLSHTTRRAEVIAIMMVVDVSGSMEALDLTEGRVTLVNYQTRLDVVKKAFADFVKRRPDDLIGLVSFGGFASTRSPITTDHDALLHILKGVQIPSRDAVVDQLELATAIGDGLATACARVENAEPKSKIVVLLTDGESNAGIIQPEAAAKAAKDLGLRVYTIGVGTSSGAVPVLMKDMFGRRQIMNAPANFSIDEGLLRRIASTTGAQYFNVRDPKGMEKALADIDKLEKTKVERDVYEQYNELFPWFLLPAMGLILLGTGLNMLIAKRIV